MKEEHSNYTAVYTRELGGIAYTTADYNKLSRELARDKQNKHISAS
jgi:hypothetical protein